MTETSSNPDPDPSLSSELPQQPADEFQVVSVNNGVEECLPVADEKCGVGDEITSKLSSTEQTQGDGEKSIATATTQPLSSSPEQETVEEDDSSCLGKGFLTTSSELLHRKEDETGEDDVDVEILLSSPASEEIIFADTSARDESEEFSIPTKKQDESTDDDQVALYTNPSVIHSQGPRQSGRASGILMNGNWNPRRRNGTSVNRNAVVRSESTRKVMIDLGYEVMDDLERRNEDVDIQENDVDQKNSWNGVDDSEVAGETDEEEVEAENQVGGNVEEGYCDTDVGEEDPDHSNRNKVTTQSLPSLTDYDFDSDMNSYTTAQSNTEEYELDAGSFDPSPLMARALQLTSEDWSNLSFGTDAETQATDDLTKIRDRLTALLLVRIVAVAAPGGTFPDYATSTICRTVLVNPEVWPPTLTPAVARQLQLYVQNIVNRYRPFVPYHNAQHAFHVVVSTNKLLDLMLGKPFGQTVFPPSFGLRHDPLRLLALMWAALIHDVDHTGLPNRQLAAESNPLAIQYNDQSIAENQSLYLAFDELLQGPSYTDLRTVMCPTQRDYQGFRKHVVNLVLNTDIASPERTQLAKSKFKEASFDMDGKDGAAGDTTGRSRSRRNLTAPTRSVSRGSIGQSENETTTSYSTDEMTTETCESEEESSDNQKSHRRKSVGSTASGASGHSRRKNSRRGSTSSATSGNSQSRRRRGSAASHASGTSQSRRRRGSSGSSASAARRKSQGVRSVSPNSPAKEKVSPVAIYPKVHNTPVVANKSGTNGSWMLQNQTSEILRPPQLRADSAGTAAWPSFYSAKTMDSFSELKLQQRPNSRAKSSYSLALNQQSGNLTSSSGTEDDNAPQRISEALRSGVQITVRTASSRLAELDHQPRTTSTVAPEPTNGDRNLPKCGMTTNSPDVAPPQPQRQISVPIIKQDEDAFASRSSGFPQVCDSVGEEAEEEEVSSSQVVAPTQSGLDTTFASDRIPFAPQRRMSAIAGGALGSVDEDRVPERPLRSATIHTGTLQTDENRPSMKTVPSLISTTSSYVTATEDEDDLMITKVSAARHNTDRIPAAPRRRLSALGATAIDPTNGSDDAEKSPDTTSETVKEKSPPSESQGTCTSDEINTPLIPSNNDAFEAGADRMPAFPQRQVSAVPPESPNDKSPFDDNEFVEVGQKSETAAVTECVVAGQSSGSNVVENTDKSTGQEDLSTNPPIPSSDTVAETAAPNPDNAGVPSTREGDITNAEGGHFVDNSKYGKPSKENLFADGGSVASSEKAISTIASLESNGDMPPAAPRRRLSDAMGSTDNSTALQARRAAPVGDSRTESQRRLRRPRRRSSQGNQPMEQSRPSTGGTVFRSKRLGIRRSMDLSGEVLDSYSSSLRQNDDMPDELKATVVMETILTAADVAQNLQSWQHMVKWSNRLYLELRRAYAAGRGPDVSRNWFRNQIGFLELYVLPLARKLESTGVFGPIVGPSFARIVEASRDKWLLEGEEITNKIIELGQRTYPDGMAIPKSEIKTLTLHSTQRAVENGMHAAFTSIKQNSATKDSDQSFAIKTLIEELEKTKFRLEGKSDQLATKNAELSNAEVRLRSALDQQKEMQKVLSNHKQNQESLKHELEMKTNEVEQLERKLGEMQVVQDNLKAQVNASFTDTDALRSKLGSTERDLKRVRQLFADMESTVHEQATLMALERQKSLQEKERNASILKDLIHLKTGKVEELLLRRDRLQDEVSRKTSIGLFLDSASQRRDLSSMKNEVDDLEMEIVGLQRKLDEDMAMIKGERKSLQNSQDKAFTKAKTILDRQEEIAQNLVGNKGSAFESSVLRSKVLKLQSEKEDMERSMIGQMREYEAKCRSMEEERERFRKDRNTHYAELRDLILETRSRPLNLDSSNGTSFKEPSHVHELPRDAIVGKSRSPFSQTSGVRSRNFSFENEFSSNSSTGKVKNIWGIMWATGLVFLLWLFTAFSLPDEILPLDIMCAPAMPGTRIREASGAFQAPWWAPRGSKEEFFDLFCGERPRVELEVVGRTLWVLDLSSGEQMSKSTVTRIPGDTVIVRSQSVVVVQRSGRRKVIEAPWT